MYQAPEPIPESRLTAADWRKVAVELMRLADQLPPKDADLADIYRRDAKRIAATLGRIDS